jgi:hypothetical protein
MENEEKNEVDPRQKTEKETRETEQVRRETQPAPPPRDISRYQREY